MGKVRQETYDGQVVSGGNMQCSYARYLLERVGIDLGRTQAEENVAILVDAVNRLRPILVKLIMPW